MGSVVIPVLRSSFCIIVVYGVKFMLRRFDVYSVEFTIFVSWINEFLHVATITVRVSRRQYDRIIILRLLDRPAVVDHRCSLRRNSPMIRSNCRASVITTAVTMLFDLSLWWSELSYWSRTAGRYWIDYWLFDGNTSQCWLCFTELRVMWIINYWTHYWLLISVIS